MVFLGIDWGEKNIGVAFSSGLVAAPLEILKIKKQEEAIEKIVQIYKNLQAEKIVLGLPLDAEGNEGNQAQKIRNFGKGLEKEIDGEIVFWNESLSSKEALENKIAAGRGRKARRQLDATSAAIILQNYLTANL